MNRLVILCIAFVNLSAATVAESKESAGVAPTVAAPVAPEIAPAYSIDLFKRKFLELPKEQLAGVVAAAVAFRLLLAYSFDESAISVILSTAAGASLANPQIRSRGSQLLGQILRRAKRID